MRQGFRFAKKRAILLFEILISLSLTAILLTFLFSFFVESTRMEARLEKARAQVMARHHLQTRLQHVLSSLDRGAMGAPLYTQQFDREKQESLVAIFDNGIDPDPAFSGSIKGRIFLDEKNHLCLVSQPMNEESSKTERKEILFSAIDRFDLEFLSTKTSSEHGKSEQMRQITPNLVWRSLWPKSQTQAPSIIRLCVYEEKKREPIRFAFILPHFDPLVTYKEKAT